MRTPRILVYQMAKVGSLAWWKAIKAACPDATVHHLHFLNPTTARRVEETIRRDDESQTFVNRTVLQRGLDRDGILSLAVGGRWSGGPVKIVTGIRDPIDRAVSLLFFFSDFYGSRNARLSFREGASAEFLLAYFIETWRAALDGDMGIGTFEQRLRKAFVRYRDWFATEVEEVFDIDIGRHAFDRERRSLVVEDGSSTALFCYRFEDLQPSTWPRVSAAASDFLGAPLEALPWINTAGGRRSRALYEECKQRLMMPVELLERIYTDSIVERFYTVEEIASFKLRWGSGRGNDFRQPAKAFG